MEMAPTALPSDIFREGSLDVPFPDPTPQSALPLQMSLPTLGPADSMTFPAFTENMTGIDTGGNCRCMTDALTTLDELEAQKTDKNSSFTNTMSAMLSTNKSALAQCTRVLECSACTFRPDRALLLVLILICRNLVSQFQQLVSGDLNASATASENAQHAHVSIDPSSLARTGSGPLAQYSVNSSEEQLQVLYTLALVRGRRLSLFLDKLKGIAGFQTGTIHREKIESIESWHRSLMERLEQMSLERI